MGNKSGRESQSSDVIKAEGIVNKVNDYVNFVISNPESLPANAKKIFGDKLSNKVWLEEFRSETELLFTGSKHLTVTQYESLYGSNLMAFVSKIMENKSSEKYNHVSFLDFLNTHEISLEKISTQRESNQVGYTSDVQRAMVMPEPTAPAISLDGSHSLTHDSTSSSEPVATVVPIPEAVSAHPVIDRRRGTFRNSLFNQFNLSRMVNKGFVCEADNDEIMNLYCGRPLDHESGDVSWCAFAFKAVAVSDTKLFALGDGGRDKILWLFYIRNWNGLYRSENLDFPFSGSVINDFEQKTVSFTLSKDEIRCAHSKIFTEFSNQSDLLHAINNTGTIEHNVIAFRRLLNTPTVNLKSLSHQENHIAGERVSLWFKNNINNEHFKNLLSDDEVTLFRSTHVNMTGSSIDF